MTEPRAKKHILLIEDEPHIVLGLTDALEFEGFSVRNAETGLAGVAAARSDVPDAIVLDLMLPDRNGFQVCEDIRRFNPSVPILMLTARSQESDKIRGLDAGADDYMTKPFGVGELVARLRALFRRMERRPPLQAFEIGSAFVDLSGQRIVVDGVDHDLRGYELELLRFLHERVGQAVSREEILDRVWGEEASPTNRTIDNFIVKLRRKVEPKPDAPRYILTVYGYGYKLVL